MLIRLIDLCRNPRFQGAFPFKRGKEPKGREKRPGDELRHHYGVSNGILDVSREGAGNECTIVELAVFNIIK